MTHQSQRQTLYTVAFFVAFGLIVLWVMDSQKGVWTLYRWTGAGDYAVATFDGSRDRSTNERACRRHAAYAAQAEGQTGERYECVNRRYRGGPR